MRFFRLLTMRVPQLVGSPWAFLVALLLTIAWIASGFVTRWSNSWLLWPSAIASVVTFLIAFSLQYTQNRDTRAIQLKLDEILRTSGARSELVKLERLSDAQLSEVEEEIVEGRQPRLEDGSRPQERTATRRE